MLWDCPCNASMKNLHTFKFGATLILIVSKKLSCCESFSSYMMLMSLNLRLAFLRAHDTLNTDTIRNQNAF